MKILRKKQIKKLISILKIIFKEDSMSERKGTKNGNKQNKIGSRRRSLSLPPTSSRPPMPPVKPPKKK